MLSLDCPIALVGFICAIVASTATRAQSPNILLILADDVGREVLGCYGGTSYKTPHIDRLAADGIRYLHAYTMPVCHPTRIALLTGQYPFRLGNPEWGTFPRAAEDRTLANVLKRAGYATAIAGKWQLALLKDDLQQPHRMGFDEYCLYGWHEGPWYYRPHIWHNGRLRTDIRDRYGPDVICECLLEFIERNKSARFFALYSMSLCHAETNDLDIPAPVGPLGRYDSYAEMVGKMDERVGRVVSTLDRLALRENTLVLFTTDNGTATHNLIDAEGDQYIYEPVVSRMGTREISGGKATLTDWGTRVPLIANWPGTIKPRQVTDNLVSVTDILPTLANVAAATLPDRVPIDGQSIPGLVRSFSTARKWVFAEHEGRCFLRNHQWKLYNDGLFYDMNADPDEKHSLGTDALSPAASTAHHELQQTLIGLAYQPAGK